jgi:hypothetical protein
VLGDGSVVSHLAGSPDNTGYHLPSLLTEARHLGVVTRTAAARAGHHRPAVALLGSRRPTAVASIAARGSCATVEAIELFLPSGVAWWRDDGAAPPFASVDGHGAPSARRSADRATPAPTWPNQWRRSSKVLDVAVGRRPR